MDNNFNLEILVPSGKVLSQSVQAVTMESEMGQVGILPAHAYYTTTLGTGVLEYTLADGRNTNALVISGGIAQFGDTTLRILADTVDLKDKVKKGEYDQDRSDLEAKLTNSDTTTPEWQFMKDKLTRIQAIDALLGM